MFKFGVTNLRRLKHVPAVGIVPITILVGRNSSGKSSFLRALPLLRQSVQTRTSSPILWFGDLVDFGSYRGSVSDNDTDKPISFMFHLDSLEVERRGSIRRYPHDTLKYEDLDLQVSIASKEDDVWLRTITLRVEDSTFKMDFSTDGEVSALKLNDGNVLDLFSDVRMFVARGSIFPELYASSKRPKTEAANFAEMYYPPDLLALGARLNDLLTPYLDKRLTKSNAVKCVNSAMCKLAPNCTLL